jgi:hypothetical protein
MAISIWDKPAELKLTPLPFEMLMKAGIMKEQQYAEGEALQGTIEDELSKINSIAIDTPIRNAELQKYQEGVRSIVDNNKGDYGAMAAQFKQLQKDFNYNKNYGTLSGVMNRYNSRVESLKEKQEAHKEYVKTNGKGGMSYEDLLAAQNWEDTHQEALVKDPTLGTWTGYNKEGARNTVNMNEKAAEASKLITPQIYADEIARAGLVPTSYGMLRYGNGTREISPAAFREELIAKYLKTDLEVQNYLGFSNRIKGVNDKINQTIPQYVGTADNNFTGIDLESGLPVMRSPEGVNEASNKIADMLYYEPLYKSAKSTGELTQVDKQNPSTSYVQNWLMKDARDRAAEKARNTTIPLNVPSTQANNSVSTTLENLNKTVIPQIMSEPVFGGSYGPGMGMSNTTVVKPDYPTVYNKLSHLDKTRVDFIRKDSKLNLPQDVTTWREAEWKKVMDALKPFETKKVSAVLNSYDDSKFRKESGSTYNANMEQFLYYDPSNSIGTKDNKMYTGAELRAAGYKIDELVGTMSNSNIIPTKVGGTAYTFARPDVINAVKLDNSSGAQLYVGINAAQINNNYRLSALENVLQISSNVGIPQPLFNNPDLVVVPKGNQNYDVMLPNGSSVPIQGNTPDEFRQSVINAYNSSPYLQEN